MSIGHDAGQAAAGKKAQVADWFGRAASVYTSPFFSYPGHRLVELAGVRPGARVLDVGCGAGAALVPAAGAVGEGGHVTGVDIAEEMVAAANGEIARLGLTNAEATEMDAEELDFPGASFDYALCGFGIGFIPDLQRALAEFMRVLKPGGVVAVSVWGEGNELAAQYRDLAAAFDVPRPSLASRQLNTAAALNAVLEEAGFPEVRVIAEQVKVIFDSKQEYWAQRMPVEQVALEELAQEIVMPFRRAVFAMLDDFLYVDGVHETRNVLYAVAGTSE